MIGKQVLATLLATLWAAAPVGHVQELQAPADPEDGQVSPKRPLDQGQLEGVPLGVHRDGTHALPGVGARGTSAGGPDLPFRR